MQIRLTDDNESDLMRLDKHFTRTVPGYSLSISQLANYLMAVMIDGLLEDAKKERDSE